MEDLSGKQFGPYVMLEPLGEGGMASVYKAFQPSVERYVAIKVLPRQYASDPTFAGRFKREAKMLASLQHPNILPVFDYGQEGEYTYMVMPMIAGGTLAALMASRRLSYGEDIHIVSQIANALHFAHTRGLVHRDVKPANVLIDEAGNCLLSDFGIARMVQGTMMLTSTGSILGTPEYMSPEQSRADQVDARSDIYSLGIILYEMLTGRVPFRADTPVAVLIKHVMDPLPLPRAQDSNIPVELERIVIKAVAKDPESRYQSAEEMATALLGVKLKADPRKTAPVGKSIAAMFAPKPDAPAKAPEAPQKPPSIAPVPAAEAASKPPSVAPKPEPPAAAAAAPSAGLETIVYSGSQLAAQPAPPASAAEAEPAADEAEAGATRVQSAEDVAALGAKMAAAMPQALPVGPEAQKKGNRTLIIGVAAAAAVVIAVVAFLALSRGGSAAQSAAAPTVTSVSPAAAAPATATSAPQPTPTQAAPTAAPATVAPTSAPAAAITPTVAAAATVAPSPTSALSATPQPSATKPAATVAPSTTPVPVSRLAAPQIQLPAQGGLIPFGETPRFQWTSAGTLGANQYYRVSVEHAQGFDVRCTQNLTVLARDYVAGLAPFGKPFRWTVSVVQAAQAVAEGASCEGTQLAASGVVGEFTIGNTAGGSSGGGGGPKPVNTPAP